MESHIWINLEKPYISLSKVVNENWKVSLNFYSLGIEVDNKIFSLIDKEFILSNYNKSYKTKKEAYNTALNFLKSNKVFIQHYKDFELAKINKTD